MAAQSKIHSASSSDGDGDGGGGSGDGGADDELLLAALLDGMDAALCAFDAEGVVTHWNREAERILGWTQEEAVGRQGLAGWAIRAADAQDVEARLLGAMKSPGRQVHEFALLTKEGGRVLVRTQSSAVADAEGNPMGVYCAFSEVHAQIDLERSIALSEALFEDASWGVVLVDADLRPAVANLHAARAFQVSRTAMLGQPLGEFVDQGLEELEAALQHVLAEGTPPGPAEIWVTLRPGRAGRAGDGEGGADAKGAEGKGGAAKEGAASRRCWRSGFLRLASPLAEEPVPLGVAWLFQDMTDTKLLEQEAARLRFRDNQLHRAARAAAECENPMEAATIHLDFALAGFADHALLDLTPVAWADRETDPEGAPRLIRAAATPVAAPGPLPLIEPDLGGGLPVGYDAGHPALQAYERCGSVRASVGGSGAPGWAAARKWPEGTVHGLCTVLRSRGRSLGVATFLRGASRRPFDRSDATYAEDIAIRIAASIDLSRTTR
ncbi:PAS domain-containing protein [Streptomyces sp. NPDC054796]